MNPLPIIESVVTIEINATNWDLMPMSKRVELVKSKGFEGKTASKAWCNIDEKIKEVLLSDLDSTPQQPTKPVPAYHFTQGTALSVRDDVLHLLSAVKVLQVVHVEGFSVSTPVNPSPVSSVSKPLPVIFDVEFADIHNAENFKTATLTRHDNALGYRVECGGFANDVTTQTVRVMLERGEWRMIEQPKTTTLQAAQPTPAPKQKPKLSAIARAGIMILGWHLARELFNAAGQGKIREFLSQGLKMAWGFYSLQDADFMRFFAVCDDDAKRAKVYALYTSIMPQPKQLSDFDRLSAPIEYRNDYAPPMPPINRHNETHALH
ncbi:MAG: hypothetical protein PHD53_00065 [Methylococcales bacterium]|nr:hypothetical protein [Methylococcales bacterium]